MSVTQCSVDPFAAVRIVEKSVHRGIGTFPVAIVTVFSWTLVAIASGYLIASGYDGDGSSALRGIKNVGGITIAQKLSTAKQADMLESAIAS